MIIRTKLRQCYYYYVAHCILFPLLFCHSVHSFLPSDTSTTRIFNNHVLSASFLKASIICSSSVLQQPYQKCNTVLNYCQNSPLLWRKFSTTLNAENSEQGASMTNFLSTSFVDDPIEYISTYLANGVSSFLIQLQQQQQQIQSTKEGENKVPNMEIGGKISDVTSYSSSDSILLFGQNSLDSEVIAVQIKTLVRVCLPALLLSIVGVMSYPSFAMSLVNIIGNENHGAFSVLSQDASQYVQNILTASGLMFSILVGYTYYFMYQQQERVFYSLFKEVSEAKSLLEQVALICAGRNIYPKVLSYISSYVSNDLKKMSTVNPAECLSHKPSDDPLEGILYLTSVGEPGVIFDTIKSLRTARAARLGALQQKLPDIHIALLRVLGAIVLVTFPVCGSGSQTIGGQGILEVQAICFGVLILGMAIVLGVITELWSPRGGAYNVDGVLSVMVRGLEEELNARMSGELGGPFGFTASTTGSNGMPLELEDENLNQKYEDKLSNLGDSKSRSTLRRMSWLRKFFNQT